MAADGQAAFEKEMTKAFHVCERGKTAPHSLIKGFEEKADADADAATRNAEAEKLGIKTRYDVVPKS